MLLYSNVICKKLTLWMSVIAVSSALVLVGCADNNPTVAAPESIDTPADFSVFAGCYTVSHDEPAQIKISEQAGAWVMQMKEPASANRVWDTPEALEMLDKTQVSKFFSIDADNVDAMIARPDRMMVLAHVKPVYATMDPLLDSEYLSYIYKGANTIYQVECDEINTDILANPHANMTIENVNDGKPRPISEL